MYKNLTVCVVVPCYNEERQILRVLTTLPSFVDHIIAVDDASSDQTSFIIQDLMKQDPSISLIRHKKNQGVGGAIASGYLWAKSRNAALTVVMAGDGQMDPADLPAILDPVAEGKADYSKGNRFATASSRAKIPQLRLWGNRVLTFFTRKISGYSHISDAQNGYTVMNSRVLQTLDWSQMHKKYGQPNDVLVKLSFHSFRVADVPHEAVYRIGEKSKMNLLKVIFPLTKLLIKLALQKNSHAGMPEKLAA